ncbi:hypothetical protein FOMG_19997 [Fusarium oxysporum f. sp. melonis 26406]|uniref:Uncharacterized protein n=1 Tax=Fusarium oxysporum f. sp. melonis 26406 TaxID=1089452 RepID=W9Z4N3_FUSOX|nr:hypothetical protein FOMG_19997 [Fusarium oxysporum f. sp. melonis 26406]
MKSLRRLTLFSLTAADPPLIHIVPKTTRALKITLTSPNYRIRNFSGSSSTTLASLLGADPSRRLP